MQAYIHTYIHRHTHTSNQAYKKALWIRVYLHLVQESNSIRETDLKNVIRKRINWLAGIILYFM